MREVKQHSIRSERVIVIEKKAIQTDEDYAKVREHFSEYIIRIKTDKSVANNLLHGTGMYTKDGRLKDEFK